MRMEDAQLEQEIITLLTTKDGGVETFEVVNGLSGKGADFEADVKAALTRLKSDGRIDSRALGKSEYWYLLAYSEPKKILIVEDDKDINSLMKLSIGDGYEVKQVYDGNNALKEIEAFKPDLVILDLMIPGPNGLEVCKKIKSNKETKSTTVIIVSAADATVNRFFGIKYGGDYYIKKPFDPFELKALTNIFLKKKGSLFDPLVDLPDVKRLLENLKHYVTGGDAEFTKIDVDGIGEYEQTYGKKEAKLIVRLVSQMLHDKINEADGDYFLSYLGGSSFVIAAKRKMAEKVLSETEEDFKRVVGFIRQKHKVTGDLFRKLEHGKQGGHTFDMGLVYYTINTDAFKKQFDDYIWPDVTEEAEAVNLAAMRNYSLEQIRKLFETARNVEVSIKEVGGNIRITAGKAPKN